MFNWKKISGVLLCLVVICSMVAGAVSCSEEEEELSYTIIKMATAVDTAGDGIINNTGEIIEYTIEVENTGNTTITGVSVSDSLSITLTRQDDDPGNDDTDLDEGEIWVYTGSYTVQQSDIDAGSIENTATVSSNELGDKSATKEVTCGETPFTGDVKIGVLLPITGMASMFGNAAKAAIEFVVDEMEAEGAFNGAEIEVVWADDQFDSTRAATEMVRLCTEENVCAVIGPLGTGMSLGASPYSDTYEVPNLTIGGGGDLIDMGLSYWHAVTPERSTGDYGRTWVDFIKYCIDNYDLPHDRIAVVSMDDSGGQRVRSAVLDRLEYYGLGDNIVLDLSLPLTSILAMDSYVLQCKAADPDIHITFAYANHSGMWVRAMDTNEYYPPFFIGTGEYAEYSFAETFVPSEIYNAVFNEEHNTPFATPVAYENIAIDSCREFMEEFSDWCDANGQPSYYSEWEPAVLAAQAMYALWDALEDAGESDPVKVNDALCNLSISQDDPHFVLPNAAPALEWESNGTMKNYFGFVCQIQNGVIRLVWPEDLSDAEPSLL